MNFTFKVSSTLLMLAFTCLMFTLKIASADVEKPKDEAFRPSLKMEPSTLNIPIEASADEIAKILNQAARKELYKGSTATRGLTADVIRNGQIGVSAADNFLYLSLPVKLTLCYGVFETPAIPVTMKFKARATVSPDWQLRTEIVYQGLSDLVAEEVRIGPVSYKPRSIVEGIVQPMQKMLSDLATQKINDAFPLKARVTSVWNTAHKPILLDKNYNAWLKLTPQSVMMFPLTTQNNRVKAGVGINTFAEVVVGPAPAAASPQPLPRLTLVNMFDKTFRIALNADLYYKDLRAIASEKLVNKTFDSDGKSVTVKNFDLYGNGDKLVVKLETTGSLEGVYYLTAKPVFNPVTNVFSVEDVDFDMQTKNFLHKSADWFLHGTIRSMIQEKLNMDLTKRLEDTRQMAGKALAKIPLADHVFLKGDIKNLRFSDVLVQVDKISIRIYTDGESAILFQ